MPGIILSTACILIHTVIPNDVLLLYHLRILILITQDTYFE